MAEGLQLVPLCQVDIVLREPVLIGDGPAGLRLVYEVESGEVHGDRLRGALDGNVSADWVSVVGSVATLDVRATLRTHDGAMVFVHYGGRTDATVPGAAPIYVAPLFETGDERYAWLNGIQGAGIGRLDGSRLHYDWFELR